MCLAAEVAPAATKPMPYHRKAAIRWAAVAAAALAMPKIQPARNMARTAASASGGTIDMEAARKILLALCASLAVRIAVAAGAIAGVMIALFEIWMKSGR